MAYYIEVAERDLLKTTLITQQEYNRHKAKFLADNGDSDETRFSYLEQILFIVEGKIKESDQSQQVKLELQREVYSILFSLYAKAGKSVTPITRLRNQCEIEKAEFLPYQVSVSIIGCKDCTYCQEFKGKEFLVHQTTGELPLNYDLCDRAMGCACVLGFIALRDDKGMLVLRK